MPDSPKRYRWRTPTHKGRWQPTRKEAQEAAVRAGEAHKDEATGRIYLSVLTEIEERD